jgi:hypothetical protein
MRKWRLPRVGLGALLPAAPAAAQQATAPMPYWWGRAGPLHIQDTEPPRRMGFMVRRPLHSTERIAI